MSPSSINFHNALLLASTQQLFIMQLSLNAIQIINSLKWVSPQIITNLANFAELIWNLYVCTVKVLHSHKYCWWRSVSVSKLLHWHKDVHNSLLITCSIYEPSRRLFFFFPPHLVLRFLRFCPLKILVNEILNEDQLQDCTFLYKMMQFSNSWSCHIVWQNFGWVCFCLSIHHWSSTLQYVAVLKLLIFSSKFWQNWRHLWLLIHHWSSTCMMLQFFWSSHSKTLMYFGRHHIVDSKLI